MSFWQTLQRLSDADLFLTTERLRLRPFDMRDVKDLARLAGDSKIYETTARIPHPYTLEHAEQWIQSHAQQREQGVGLHWAITTRHDHILMGVCGLDIRAEKAMATLGYWLGVPYWGRGYGKEAAGLVTAWTLRMGAKRLEATCMSHNQASLRILERCGFRQQHVSRAQEVKPGVVVDVVHFERDAM